MQLRTIFVGGAIQHATTLKNTFNQDIRDLLEFVICELEKNSYKVLSAHRYESYGKLDVSNQEIMVCKRDFGWMKECDLFIAVLPEGRDGYSIRTDGTCVELGWASSMKKPVVILTSENTKYSHLIKGLPAVASVEFVDIASMQKTPKSLITIVEKLLTNHYQ